MTCWKSLTALKEDPCQIIGTTKSRKANTSKLFSLSFHFTYRVQYFLTLLLLVKGAGSGQIQSGDRGQVKLNFLELLAKRKSAGPLYEITGNGAIHSRYWIEDTGKVIVNVFRCYWMEGFLQLLPGLEDNPLISRRNKLRILEQSHENGITFTPFTIYTIRLCFIVMWQIICILSSTLFMISPNIKT